MDINDLKCCGNCLKYDNLPFDCDRRKLSDYDINPSDCCNDWIWDGTIHSQRTLPPYYNSNGN